MARELAPRCLLMRRLNRRLQLIESKVGTRTRLYTREEIHLGRFFIAQAIARRKDNCLLGGKARQLVERLEGEIKRCVKMQSHPSFTRHIKEYVLPLWNARAGTGQFLPPILGSEFDDWEAPNLYQRRLAVRHCSSVIELIGHPDPQWGSPHKVICWYELFGAVLNGLPIDDLDDAVEH